MGMAGYCVKPFLISQAQFHHLCLSVAGKIRVGLILDTNHNDKTKAGPTECGLGARHLLGVLLANLVFTTTYEVDTISIPILQTKKLRHKGAE